MFILYAVLGGPAHRSRDRRIDRAARAAAASAGRRLIAIGMVAQLALFSTPVGDALGAAAPWVYVADERARPRRRRPQSRRAAAWPSSSSGACNVVAIVANGGYMPVSPGALAAMGRSAQTGYSNSRLVTDVRLAPLTDLFAMPTWVPAANVFSIGDVLIGVGAAIAIVAAMHGRGPIAEAPAPARCHGALTRRCRPRTSTSGRYRWPSGCPTVRSYGATSAPDRHPAQGKPIARWGRKARDLSETAQLPDPVDLDDHSTRWFREGEPGALHPGPVAPGDHGPVPGCRNQVVLTMDMVKRPTDTDDRRFGPLAGHRWS